MLLWLRKDLDGVPEKSFDAFEGVVVVIKMVENFAGSFELLVKELSL